MLLLSHFFSAIENCSFLDKSSINYMAIKFRSNLSLHLSIFFQPKMVAMSFVYNSIGDRRERAEVDIAMVMVNACKFKLKATK